MSFQPAIKTIKWLIYTNIYIALAAVSFQLVTVFLSNNIENWNFWLTIHTFFSTLAIYQFSRYQFHVHAEVPPVKRDEIFDWVDNNLSLIKWSAFLAILIAAGSLFMIRFETVKVLILLGVISVLYPLKLPKSIGFKGLRSIPFIKVFLISFVWAAIGVWVPVTELALNLSDYIWFFVFQGIFILFITLPFDVVDVLTDKATKVKTIPAVIGKNTTHILIFTLLIALIGLMIIGEYQWSWWTNIPFVIIFLGMLGVLLFFSVTLHQYSDKWKVMAVHDGSMIFYGFITACFYVG